MDVAYFLGGLLFFTAPPIVSVFFRKIRKSPSLKNPIWQYVITFFVMTAILLMGAHDYFGMILIMGFFIYIIFFYIDYSMYKKHKNNDENAVAEELKNLDFNDKDAVMSFAKANPQLTEEINKLLTLNKRLGS